MKALTGWVLSGGFILVSGIVVASCGSDSGSTNSPPPAPPPVTAPITPQEMGAYNFSCGGQTASQQQQVPFQEDKQESCNSQQKIQFIQSRVSDFDMKLDCNSKQVVVKNKGPDQKQKNIPIQQDGSIQGQIQYLQRIADDGNGHMSCWVAIVTNFEGKAHCDAEDSLDLNTSVSFQQTTAQQVEMAGVAASNESSAVSGTSFLTDEDSDPAPDFTILPIPEISPSPSPSPSPSSSPSLTPSPSPSVSFPIPSATPSSFPGSTPTSSPSPTPSPSLTPIPIPSGTPSRTPTATPTPTMTASVPPAGPVTTVTTVCVVSNPCPKVGKTKLGCPAQQSPY